MTTCGSNVMSHTRCNMTQHILLVHVVAVILFVWQSLFHVSYYTTYHHRFCSAQGFECRGKISFEISPCKTQNCTKLLTPDSIHILSLLYRLIHIVGYYHLELCVSLIGIDLMSCVYCC